MLGILVSALLALGACTGEGQGPSPPDIGDSQITTIPSYIDPTGTTDVTEALVDFINSVPDGWTICFPAGALYRAEGTILLQNRNDITIDGKGGTLFASTDGTAYTPPKGKSHLWPRSRSHIEILGGSNITIRNLTIRGANPNAGSAKGAYVRDLEGQHGLDIRGLEGLVLDKVTITDTYGDLLYLGAHDGRWTQKVQVTGVHFERSGRQGIAITGAEDVLVRDSYVGEVGRSIIDLEPNTPNGGARNIQFLNNTFGPCRHLWMTSGGKGPNVENIAMIGNRLEGMQMQVRVGASDGSRRSGYRFVNNSSDVELSAPVAAFRFLRVDSVEVAANVQRMDPEREMTGVFACESTALRIEGNDFTGVARNVEVVTSACPIEPTRRERRLQPSASGETLAD